MANVLTSGTAVKAAGDRERIPMDFGNIRQLQEGASIIDYDVTCADPDGPTISGIQLDYPYQVSALFSGGTTTGDGGAGTYDIVFSITLDDTDATVIARTGPLRIL